jgi:hypothetical protein
MKLRIRQNSIRLRLKRGEVDQIASGKSIVEETRFPDSVLSYRLNVSDEGKFSTRFNDGNLVICVPADELSQWAKTDQVSMAAELALEGSDALSLLIEKDFSCLAPGHHRPDEDDADTYPHPEG